ncbi:hypothetical protein B9G54_01060 [Alloscardovia macacae]|uniref:Single-stranded DNA-binding protein n=1 Tax=Alloscardovia macacae TaxID=1160091 RepID=A0A1Y2T0R7_9BIFI|nr:single-stranded DNA-binding protein [Alloscardovia macacae]OTA27415.1 hypothetical protein B9G54_01060 [Alloscardovia macacae]OTA29427.1 hypothetical protein B9T39_03495 [Alloscardovia macacae]
MANIAQTIITGYVAADPKQWTMNSQMPACSFRVGSTRRYFSAKDNQWKSNDTLWVNVKAFRGIAVNVLGGIKKGDPVIVVGNLTVDTWEKDGVTHTIPSIEATHVGLDLSAGRVIFKTEKVRPREYVIPADASAPAPEQGSTDSSAPVPSENPFDYSADLSVFTPPVTDEPSGELGNDVVDEFAPPAQGVEVESAF